MLCTLPQLFDALVLLIRECLYQNTEKTAEVLGLLPQDFHPDLGKLLGKQISKQIPAWRQSALLSQVSPPKLIDVDWRVDMQTSSNLLARMAVPTVFVEMKVGLGKHDTRFFIQDGSHPCCCLVGCFFIQTFFFFLQLQESPQEQGVMPGTQNVQFELSKPALATMLHGLEKVSSHAHISPVFLSEFTIFFVNALGRQINEQLGSIK